MSDVLSNQLYDALLDLLVEDDDPDAPGSAPPSRPLRLARVRHEGRPWLHHWVRVPDAALVDVGDRVIFKVPGDSAFGTVVDAPALRVPEGDPQGMPVLEVMTADEVAQTAERVSKRETEAFTLFRERIVAMRLPMKPVHVEMSALQQRTVFYFWSDQRVDFRNLLAELRRRIQGQIDLTQVGPHEAARQIGGIGRCHRELCARVMPSYPPVSPKHARTQGLSPNPQKHVGACGRLMSCLAYEQEQYAEARKGLPKEGKTVETPLGKAVIKELDILRGRVRVRTEEGQWETFHVSELKRDGKPIVASTEPETVDTMDVDAEEHLDFELAGRGFDAGDAGEASEDASPLARAATLAPRVVRPAAKPPQKPSPKPAPARPAPPPAAPPAPRAERGERSPRGKTEPAPRGDAPQRPGGRPGSTVGRGVPAEGTPAPRPQKRPEVPAAQRPAPRAEVRPDRDARTETPDAADETEADETDAEDGDELEGEETGAPEIPGAPRKKRRRRRRKPGGGAPAGGGGSPAGGGGS
jgi:cell fate regulator YaaT (PSP1 superfamily)